MTSFLLVTRVLPKEQYGGYVGLYGLLGAVGAFSYSGVGLALLQRLLGERDEPNRALRSFLSLAMLAGATMAVVAVGLSLTFLRLSVVEVILIATAELVGTATIYVSSILVQAASGFAAATRVRLGLVSIRLVSVVTLKLAGQLSIANLGASFLVGFALYAVYLLVVHLPRHGYEVSFGWPSRLALRSSGVFSIPMGAGKLQTDADKFMLNAFGFRAEAGVYGAAYRLIQVGIMPLMALDTAAFQRFLPKGADEAKLHWRRAIRLARLTMVASVMVSVALYVVLPYLDFLLEAQYRQAFDIAPWLLPLIPLIATSGTPLNGLLGLGQSDKRMLVYLSSAFISLILYAILIPPLDWRGAVIATFISEIYLAIAGWWALWYYQGRADAARANRIMTPV